jgi:hypothetical protein
MRRLCKHLSPSMVVACIALLVALGGVGVAAVRLPANSVGAIQLKANSVNSAKVANRSLRAIDFALNQLPAGPQGPAGPAGPKGEPGARGPIGPSDGYADTNPGPFAVNTFDTRVATLRIPTAGSYGIWSKIWIWRTAAGQPKQQSCTLKASDGAEDRTLSTAVTASPEEMVNLLPHEFAGETTVNLFCYATGPSQGFDAKIAAIKVGNLTLSTG